MTNKILSFIEGIFWGFLIASFCSAGSDLTFWGWIRVIAFFVVVIGMAIATYKDLTNSN